MLLFVQRQFEAGNIIAQEFVDFGKPHGFESGKLRGFGFGEFIEMCIRDSPFTREANKNRYREVPKMRVKITLACSECKQRNYNTMKNKKNDPDRLEMNKYCRFCRKHTLHRETK